MDDLSKKRFVRALRAAQELLMGEARCYRYEHSKEYQEVIEDIKFAIRALEDGEEFTGKLLFKNAQSISYTAGLNLARQAKTAEERNFFAFIGDMNLQREQQNYIKDVEPMQYPKKEDCVYVD